MRDHTDALGIQPQKGHLDDPFSRPQDDLAEGLPDTPTAVVIVDKRGIVSFCSPAVGNLFHSSEEQLEGCDVSSLLPGLPLKKKTPGHNLAFAESWEQEGVWRKIKGTTPGGESLLLDVSLRKISMANDQFILLGMRPATDDSRSVEALSQLIEGAIEVSDAMMITDTAGIIEFVNPAFEESTGYSLEESVGQNSGFIKPDYHNPEIYSTMWETLLSGKDFRTILANRKKSGEIYYEDTQVQPFVDELGVTSHFVAIGRRLSEPVQDLLLRLQREAYHDALTGLPNRNLFADRLRQSFSRASRRNEKFSLAFIDLDNFKEINDAFGHAGGDAVLRATADSLRASIREEDTVARLGGDEFALILDNVHRQIDVERVSNKILMALAKGVFFEDRNIPIHVSIGASLYPDDGDNSDVLLQHADVAMYAAKSEGGNCLHLFTKENGMSRGNSRRVAQTNNSTD